MSDHKEHKEHKEHEHVTAEALSVKLEGSEKARSWIVRSVIIFLVLVFFGGMALGASDLLTREGQQPPEPVLDASITDPPEGSEAIYAYVQKAMDMALAEKPKFFYDTTFAYEKDNKYLDEIAFTGGGQTDEWLKNAVQLVALGAAEQIYNCYPSGETQYGDDFSQRLWNLPFEPAQLESAKCTFVYYRCTACGKGEDEWKAQCPECKAKGTEDKPIMVKDYRGDYALTLYFADDSPLIDEVFHTLAPEDVQAMLAEPLVGTATLTGIGYTFRNARIEAAVNRTTGRLQSLKFKRDVDARLDLTLEPQFSGLGSTTLSLPLAESANFRFTWPAAVLSSHERTMDPKGNSQLTVRLDAPDGQETPHTWSSSDEAICAVDQEGYLKAGKEPGEAVISVSFELDGKTITDECTIKVKVPAEKAKLNRRSLKLDPGEVRQLKATVTPRNASYKDVTWHSENPDIAIVDNNGTITALRPGQVSIYALSADGYYRASCAVTVTGGEG